MARKTATKKQAQRITALEQMILTRLPKKGGKKKRVRKSSTVNNVTINTQNITKLPFETLRYGLTVADPFRSDQSLVGVPRSGVPSHKVRGMRQFTVNIASTDDYVVMGFTPTLANDKMMCTVWRGSAANASADTVGNGSPAGSTQISYMTSLPYTASQLTGSYPGLTGRIVAAGLRIGWSGAVLNRGGILQWLETENHEDLLADNSSTTYANVISLVTASPHTHHVQMTKQTDVELSVGPMKDTDTQYTVADVQSTDDATGIPNRLYPFSTNILTFRGQADTGSPVAWAVWNNPGSVAGQLHVQVVEHVEYIGPAARASYSHSHEDEVNVRAITGARSNAVIAHANNPGKPFVHTFLGELEDNLKAKVKEFGPKCADLVRRTLAGKASGDSAMGLVAAAATMVI